MRYEQNVRLLHDEMTGNFKLFILRNWDGKRSFLTKDGVWKEFNEGDSVSFNEALVSLDRFAAEQLATELANKNVKPIQASFVEGKLEATEKHLQDMRKLLKL